MFLADKVLIDFDGDINILLFE